jgi:hypothetical protein
MAALSLTASETAKQGMALALKALATPGKASACASAMCTSESQISKLKNEKLEDAITLLAWLGLKVVPSDYEVIDPHMLAFSKRLLARVTERDPDMLWRPDA